MSELVRSFCSDEDGAVTIDWVVLTALVVGLAAAAFAGVEGGVENATAAILTFLESTLVGT